MSDVSFGSDGSASLTLSGDTNPLKKELDARRLEDWDRAAFVAARAYNANPFLKKWVDVRNPLRDGETVLKIDLANVPGLD